VAGQRLGGGGRKCVHKREEERYGQEASAR
jgi:hypothetical protein